MLKPAVRRRFPLTEIVHARRSSTVVLARETGGEPEIFLVQRHAAASFGAAYAFPGGVVDPEDGSVHDYCKGLSSKKADANLGVKGDGLDYYSAAVRELFEEAGVLLANPDDIAEGPSSSGDSARRGPRQRAMHLTTKTKTGPTLWRAMNSNCNVIGCTTSATGLHRLKCRNGIRLVSLLRRCRRDRARVIAAVN